MSNMQLPEITPRMEPEAIDAMLAHALRFPDLFSLAIDTIQPEFFQTNAEPHLLALWVTVQKVLATYGKEALFAHPAQAKNMLTLELQAYCRANPTAVQDAYQQKLFDPPNGLLLLTYDTPISEFGHSYAKDLLRKFVEERYVQDPLRRMLMQAGGQTVLNLPDFLSKVKERQQAVAALDDNPVAVVCPEDWTPTPLGKFSTGISFLDKFMNGGHARGETYGVLGAFGSGKTTLAVQLVVGGSLYQLAKSLASVGSAEPCNPKKWYFFHYEGSKDEMRVRLLSCLCEIDKDLIEEWRVGDMSTIGNLKPYEAIRWGKMLQVGEEVLGERERWEQKRLRINDCFGMIDMSGDPSNPKRGQGYIPEITSIIDRDLRESSKRMGYKVEAAGVVVDYAGLCVRRHIAGKPRSNPEDYYQLLSSIGEDARRLVAVPFQCPVWLMHQLSGQANKKTTSSKQGHADAAGSASFAENLYFCFALGTKDSEYGSVQLSCSKSRRAAELGKPPRLEFDKPIAALKESDLLENASGQLRRSAELKSTM